jgi:hypothetical protein
MKEQALAPTFEPQESASLREARTLQEEIAALAYSLWQSRGCPEGTPDEDWFNAEEILRTNGGAQSMRQEACSTVFAQVTLQQAGVGLAEIDHDQAVEGVREIPIDIERYKLAPQL